MPDWVYCPPGMTPETLTPTSYMELARDTYREQYGPSNEQFTRIFLILWSDRTKFVQDLIGWAQQIPDPAGPPQPPQVNWVSVPDEHPERPKHFCVEAQVEPYPTGYSVVRNPPNDDYPTFRFAKVTAHYKYLMYDIMTDTQILANPFMSEMDRFTERKYKNNVEAFTLQGQMKFVSTTPPRVLNRPPAKRFSTMIKEMTWHDVPCNPNRPFEPPNLSAINVSLGRVNIYKFDVNQGNHPPGTVLCLSVDAKPQPPKVGEAQLYYDIMMRFLIMDNGVSTFPDPNYAGEFLHFGHQFVWDQMNNRWDLITHNGDANLGYKVYAVTDLNRLWELDP